MKKCIAVLMLFVLLAGIMAGCSSKSKESFQKLEQFEHARIGVLTCSSQELIKATAVVGYVAVNDLTKMGDIIRSNTYEAFFPLIATAVIYFLLTWMLALLLGCLKRHYEPKCRSKEDILKGVKAL